MLTLDKASELSGIEKKNLREFNLVTPLKHEVRGYISLTRGLKMGSLIIDTVDGKQTLQYVQGMPKIHYVEANEFIDKDNAVINLFDKADGTNILFFPLIKDNEVIEVLTKTRLMPSTQDKWNEILKRIPNLESYKEATKDSKLSLSCEMYGFLNPHAVEYSKIDIPLSLDVITVLDNGRTLITTEADKLASKFKLKRVDRFADIIKGKVNITEGYKKKYKSYVMPLDLFVPNNFVTFNSALENYFEEINVNFQKVNKTDGIITEGIVAHIDYLKKSESKMLKIKATTVKEEHLKASGSIPELIITKALEKAYENLESIDDEGEVTKFIKEELREEYPEEAIEKSNIKIAKTYKEFYITKKLIKKLQLILKDLEGLDIDISDKMRMFAKKYPELKDKSRLVYQILTKQI